MTGRREHSVKREAFEALAAPQLRSLYGFALSRLRSPQAADDMVQETCLKAYQAFDRFEAGTDFRGWLFRILINAIHDWHRKSPKMAVVSLDDRLRDARSLVEAGPPTTLDPESRLIAIAREAELQAALAELPPTWQTVILLSLVEGLSYKQMAEVLECPVGTVMSRLYRARQALRRRLAHWLDGDEPGAGRRRPPKATVSPLEIIRSRLKR